MAFLKERRAPFLKPVVLTGLMGSGKTTVGAILAQRLGLPFHDSDAVVTARSVSVADVFEREGEAAFRELEHAAVAALLDGERAVIATGGGAVLHPVTRALLKACAFTVWLDADPAVLAARLRNATDRPLLRSGDPGAVLMRQAEQRRPFYAKADLRIRTGTASPDELAEQIAAALDVLSLP